MTRVESPWREGGQWFDYSDRPIDWIKDALGVSLWHKQDEVIRALWTSPRVAVRSGHKCGKSLLASCAALAWLYTKKNSRVILSAPSARQVRQILWREIKRLHRFAPAELEGQLYDMPDRGLVLEDSREMLGVSTDSPENLAGLSGENILIILDEASGFSDDLFTVILGTLAGGGSLLLIGNPTRLTGEFYRAFHENSRFWSLHHISSEETPNAVDGSDSVPGLATRAWIEQMREEWGEDSPLYQIRVKGEFPVRARNAVIGMDLIESAIRRWKEWKETAIEPIDKLVIGVDPARFGDDQSAVFPVRGNVAFPPHMFSGVDTVTLADHVLEIAMDLKRGGEIPLIVVDEIGIGAGVVDALRQHPRLSVRGINVAEAARSEQYERRRDEAWFAIKNWLKQGGMIPDDAKLQADLLAPTFDFSLRQKIKVESKDETKARLHRSPDRADALALACLAVLRDIESGPRLNGRIGIGRRRI